MHGELIDLLRRVSSGFRACMQDRIAADGSGLTSFQARLVNAVGRNEGVSQLELGSFMERDKAQIARAVKEMEARGLLARSAHETDWRTKSVALTQEGRAMHERLMRTRSELAAETLGNLTEVEKHALRAGLMKIDAALQEELARKTSS